MSGTDVRELFSELVTGSEPPWHPDVDGVLRKGRGAARRRRAAVLGGAAGVVAVAVTASVVAPALARSSSPGSARVPAPPAAAASRTPAAGNQHRGPAVWPPESGHPYLPGGKVSDAAANRALALVADRLDPGRKHLRFTGYRGALDARGYEEVIFTGDWQVGARAGTVQVGFYAPGVPLGSDPSLPLSPAQVTKAHLCGARPAREDSFHWTSCRTEQLPDGGTLRQGTGQDRAAEAITAGVTRRDGSSVSISVSTAGYERHDNGAPIDPKLATLPLTAAQVRALVTDPALVF